MPAAKSNKPTINTAAPTGGLKRKRADLSASEILSFGPSLIGISFKHFNSDINEIWEDYCAIDFYLHELHELIKSDGVPTLSLRTLTKPSRLKPQSKRRIYGIFSRIQTKANGQRAFVDAVGKFEDFFARLTYQVYIDNPGKLNSLDADGSSDDPKRRQKVISWILESATINEILQKIIEEKVRGIFYGNPIDLFKKDKAHLGFGKHFENNHQNALELFREITARRNVIVHNQGRIDRKYLLEVPACKLAIDTPLLVDAAYLETSIYTFKELAAASAERVIISSYSQKVHQKKGRLSKILGAITSASKPAKAKS